MELNDELSTLARGCGKGATPLRPSPAVGGAVAGTAGATTMVRPWSPSRLTLTTASELTTQRATIVDQFAAALACTHVGLFDHLAAGPLTASELAHRCDVTESSLTRTLRQLPEGVLIRIRQRYTLGPLGQASTSASSGGHRMRPAVLVAGAPGWEQAVRGLPPATGIRVCPLGGCYGLAYEDLLRNPVIRVLAGHYMARWAQRGASRLAGQSSLFAAATTVVDVTGGGGLLLADILQVQQSLSAVLVDRPEMLSTRRWYRKLAHRVRVAGGDLMALSPRGAGVYLLGSAIRSHAGGAAVLRLLGHLRGTGAIAVLVDRLIPEGVLATDMQGAVMLWGGQERTHSDYMALAQRVGATVQITDVGDRTGLQLITMTL
ncbi:methyltransferase [Sphaerisporangium album]|nr:methyltransferase [Sphaerisporangium album]